MARVTKYLLLLPILMASLISCSVKQYQSGIQGKWINLSVCSPDNFLIFNFSNRTLTTLENKVYRFHITRRAIKIQVDSVISVPYIDILPKGDTLEIIFDERTKLSLLKFQPAVNGGFSNHQLYELKFPTNDSNRYRYLNFLTREKVVATDVNLVSNDTIPNVFPFFQYKIDDANILNFGNIFCNTFLLEATSNDTIRALSVIENKFYESKIFPYRGPIKAKATVEALIGFWKVVSCRDPSLQNFSSLRFSENELVVEGRYSGVYTSKYSLDLLGLMIVSNFDHDAFDLIEIHEITKDSLVVSDNHGADCRLTRQ